MTVSERDKQRGYQIENAFVSSGRELGLLIATALAEERERCAKIADSWDDGYSNSNYAHNIADEIRQQGRTERMR